MILSMTGFGRASAMFNEKKISVEVRTLNSKTADISLRCSSIYKAKEINVRNLAIKHLRRGKIDISIYVENNEVDKKVSFNKELMRHYYNELKEFNNELDNNSPEFLSMILRMPDVTSTERSDLDKNEWNKIEETVIEALNEVVKYRSDEGLTLLTDLEDRISTIENLTQDIPQYEGDRIETVKQRITQNLENLANKDYDANRLEQELVFYLEKFDINEEKVRLKANLDYFRTTMNGELSEGKKLGFITQEIGREINTTGSKANHQEIQKIVVQMKDELEKIKEQILNVL